MSQMRVNKKIYRLCKIWVQLIGGKLFVAINLRPIFSLVEERICLGYENCFGIPNRFAYYHIFY